MRLLIFILLFAASAFSQIPTSEPGVSQELAKWRASQYSNISYKLNLTFEKMSPVLKGSIEIHVTQAAYACAEPNCPPMAIILDWRKIRGHEKDSTISNVTLNGSELRLQPRESITPKGVTLNYEESNEHLIFREGVRMGENVIKLDFTSPILTSGSAITRYVDKEDGAEYVYSLFVPSDASTAFPVFDQPDLKARFTIAATVPGDWKFITNQETRASVETDFPMICPTGTRCVDTRPARTFFFASETQPISTYVFAFAAGPFKEFNDTGGNATVKERALSDGAFGGNGTLVDTRVSARSIYVRKSQAEKFKPHAAEVFRLNREAVKYLETYFDYKFPWPKYDLVLIPEFPFGGMEHAGATFLREQSVIFPQEPTKNDVITRANLIFHEAAHQWFGDTVTMKWFDDLWLKEGFATFMAYKALDKIMPEAGAWKVFYERVKQAAYRTDSTRGTTAIYQPIANLSAAKSAYGNIVYNKAPAFLRQAEFYLGEDKFQTAVRAFLKKHEFKNAGWEDLVDEIGNVSWQQFSGAFNIHMVYHGNPDGTRTVTKSYEEPRKFSAKERAKAEEKGRKNLKAWASNWVNTRGLSIVRAETGPPVASSILQSRSDHFHPGFRLFARQRNALGEKRLSDLNFVALLRYGNLSDETAINLRGDEEQVTLNYSPSRVNVDERDMRLKREPVTSSPTFLFPNYRDYDYGIFLLDDKSRDYVLKNIQNEKDDFLRTMMWGSLWDSVREGELDPKEYVELVLKNIATEKDEGTIQTLLFRVTTAMNYYLSDATGGNASVNERASAPKGTLVNTRVSARSGLQTRLENLLIDKIQNASTQGQRITYYRAFLNIASTEKARGILKQILNAASPKLSLKTKDKFDIVTRLASLGDPDAAKLLAGLEKTETSDDAKRYAYAARAAFATAENKAKFWNDFINNKDISESWIEEAVETFNSIRHSELTFPYLEKALAELPKLKRDRKIFFVNGWLAEFIGGQRSKEALDIVNKFLADNPNLDNDLRLKILENVDVIERAVKIRSKFPN